MRYTTLRYMACFALMFALNSLWAPSAQAQLSVRGFVYDTASGIFTPIDDPNAVRGTMVWGINDSGTVIGSWLDASNNGHGFTMSGGVYTELNEASGVPGGESINNSGEIAGVRGGADKRNHGFIYNGSTTTTFDEPNAPSIGEGTNFRAINNLGQVVGHYYPATGDLSLPSSPATGPIIQGFLYNAGIFTTIAYPGASITFPTDIDDNGNIIGSYYLGAGLYHFRLSSGVYTTIANDPIGMNNAGQLVGDSVIPSGCGSAAGAPTCSYYAYIINGATLTTISNPLATRGTVVMKINNNGKVVGYYYP